MTQLPAGIKDLTRIRSIDVSHNAIEGLPDNSTWEAIGGSLELLDVSFNKLSSIEPLAPLSKLSSLKVDGNQLTSLQGVSWSKLKQLSTLTAAGNQITEIPEEVSEVGNSLEHFELGENKVVSYPAGICELKKLKFLSMGGNPIKDQKAVKALEKGVKDLKTYIAKASGGKKK